MLSTGWRPTPDGAPNGDGRAPAWPLARRTSPDGPEASEPRPAWPPQMTGAGSSSKALAMLGADTFSGAGGLGLASAPYTPVASTSRHRIRSTDGDSFSGVSPLSASTRSRDDTSPTSASRPHRQPLRRATSSSRPTLSSRPSLLSAGLLEADERDSPPPSAPAASSSFLSMSTYEEGPMGETRRPRHKSRSSSHHGTLPRVNGPSPVPEAHARVRTDSFSASAVPRGSPIPSASGGSIMGGSLHRTSLTDGEEILSSVNAPMQNIAPWVFEPPESSGDPNASPGSIRTLKHSKSAHALTTDSPKKDKRGGLFGLIKRKASARDGGLNDGFRMSEDDGGASMFSNPFAGARTANGRQGSVPNDMKRSKKGRERSVGASDPPPLQPNGFSLDTDLDRMEGIIDFSGVQQSSFTGSTSATEALASESDPPSDTANGVRSTTPDGIALRRPSAAFSSSSVSDSREGSPLSQRSLADRSNRKGSLGDIYWMAQQPAAANGAAPGHAGLGLRKPSVTVTVASADGRRGSLTSSAVPSANWIAPESWAVEGDADDAKDGDDESDENDESLAAQVGSPNRPPTAHSLGGPSTPKLGSERRDSLLPTIGGSVTKQVFSMGTARRPGTSGSTSGAHTAFGTGKLVNHSFRVYKLDGTHTTISCSLTQPVAELQQIVQRKAGFAVPGKGPSRLYARERGLERMLGPTEKPLLLQRRRFEQAGYTDSDKLEEIGREDHSYLIKFIYKPEHGPSFAFEDDSLDGFEYIDLQARALQSVPIFLYRHAHEIVSLNLSKNPRLDLPSDFVQLCASLRELRMANMAIKRVPQSVRQAPGLTRLDVSNNRIVELDHVALDEATELLSLKAHNNRLWQLPEYFGRFRSLKYLQLSNNKFDTFPAVVCEIASLVDLDVSYNSIAVLPDAIGKLVHLERLILSTNLLTTLPSTLDQLVGLREFDCRRNQVVDFSVVAKLPKLEVARCAHNAAIAFELRTPNARVLNLQFNPFQRLAFEATGLTLTTLNLGFGRLSSFPGALFAELGSLENLILDNNQIKTLEPSIGDLAHLQKLQIRCNNVDAVPESIGRLQRLQILDLSNNDLATLPATIWQCGELISLNASSNLMTEFPDAPLTIIAPTTLDGALAPGVEDGGAYERKPSTASKQTSFGTIGAARQPSPMAVSLQRLSLADNQLTDGVFHRLTSLADLRVLNLSFNELYDIPTRTLSKLQLLEELYLSGNYLATLPEDDMERLIQLRILHLNGNKLQTLPAELGTIKKLQVLDVGSNVLKYNIANWKYDWNWNWNLDLRYLNLSGNKRLEIKPAGPQAMHNFDSAPGPGSGPGSKRRNLSDFSALRKLRTLGLMDVTLMIPTVPDDTEDRRVRTSLSEINDMAYGIADALGRAGMIASLDLVAPRFRGHEDECLFGLFDARTKTPQTAGRITKYLQDSFSATLSIELGRLASARDVALANALVTGAEPTPASTAASDDAVDALRRAFLNLNRDYGNILLPAFDARRKDSDTTGGAALADRFQNAAGTASDVRSGASGVVVYLRGRRLHVANAGDAIGVLSRRGVPAIVLGSKHDPTLRDEVGRIRDAEGWISTKGLVNDELDVARSFGHYHVFPAVNACPTVTTVELTEDDEFVIVANKALWSVMSHQAAVDVARRERADPMIAAQKLRDLAIAYGSDGSLMVMVVAVGDLFKAKSSAPVAGPSSPAEAEASRQRRGGVGAFGERYLTLLDREVAPPTGSLAIVFTDIRSSTSLWDTNFSGMQTAMRMHNQLLRRQLRAIGGYEVKTEGDSFMVSFPTVSSALLWCFTVQLELLREDWPHEILELDECREILGPNGELLYRGLSIRMGMHWGQPLCETDPITRRMDYFGPMVNRSARIEGAAEGGQICASADAIELIKQICSFDASPPAGESSDVPDDADALARRLAADDELDELTKRDVLGLRKLGFGITELGERRLKGLETPEFLSLIYPTALAGRLKVSIDGDDLNASTSGLGLGGGAGVADRPAETFEPIPHLIDVYQIQQLGQIVLRLEAAGAAICRPALPSVQAHMATVATWSPATPRSPMGSVASGGGGGRRSRRYQPKHPFLQAYPVRIDSTDEELFAVLEGFVIRCEHVLSSLALHSLGPYNEVLAALASAVKLDADAVLKAITVFAGVMGQQGLEGPLR